MRTFTRADVEARWNQIWGEDTETQKWYVKNIQMVSGLTPPTWAIEFNADTYEDGRLVHAYHDMVLLIEKQDVYGHPVLRTTSEIELPVGCATVTDEDNAIKRAEEEIMKGIAQ